MMKQCGVDGGRWHTLPCRARVWHPWWGGLALGVIALLAMGGCDEVSSSAGPASVAATGEAVPETVAIELKGEAFELELALTDDEQFQGLSDREVIAEDGGMVFVFGSAERRAFVMRRCLVPIDIAFISPAGTVTAAYAMAVEPYDRAEMLLKRYSSRYPAQYVIEVKGGTWERIGLRAGDRLTLPMEKLKAWRRVADGQG